MRKTAFSIFFAIITLIGLAGNSWAQDSTTGIELVGKYVERFDKEFGQVRGDVVMGSMLGPPDIESLPDSPSTDGQARASGDVEVNILPTTANATRTLCVRLTSKDGRFEAENTYRVQHDRPLPGGPFPYLGEYQDDFQSKKLVSNVSLGACGNRIETLIPSSWAGMPLRSRERALHLFVNSAGNSAFVEIDGFPLVECSDVAEEDTLKYTAACLISSDALEAKRDSNGQVAVTVIVSRMLGDDVFPVRIFWPDLEN